MARRIFLHVGSPKTGTTFLQEVLWSHRELAKEQGLLLPLDGFFDHYLATLVIREIEPQPQDAERAHDVWNRVVEEADAWDGDVLVSHELFAAATRAQAQRAVAAFGQEAEVHVVVTARDLVRQIPAEWQEHVKHRSTMTFPQFVDDLRREDPQTWFWRVQSYPDVLRRWGASVPRERLHLVTVPPPGQPVNLLWERFAGLVGLAPEAFSTTGLRSNTSLGYEQAELLRRVNEGLGERLQLPGPYAPVVKSMFAERLLSRQHGAKLTLTGTELRYAVEKSAEVARSLEREGVDVIGSLQELVPAAADGEHPADPPDDLTVLAESLTALTALLDEYADLRRRAINDRGELLRLRALENEWRERPAVQYLRGLGERRPWAGRALSAARRGRDGARALGVRRRHR